MKLGELQNLIRDSLVIYDMDTCMFYVNVDVYSETFARLADLNVIAIRNDSCLSDDCKKNCFSSIVISVKK